MKGVILAGGLGSRMYPLTKITNKHLLPVYDKPMIYYPIETLVQAGIKDILVVTGGNSSGDFLKLLGNGQEFGLNHITYAYQDGEGGIAQALSLAQHFAGEESIMVILGDNIIGANLGPCVRRFEKQKKGARLLLKKVHDPERFGVAELNGKKVAKIVEKPKKPKSNHAVIGVYMYDNQVFDIIPKLKPSKRGELEITDVNNWYLKQEQLEYDVLDGYWTDAGTFESLHRASVLIEKKSTAKKNTAKKNAAPKKTAKKKRKAKK